MTNREKGRIKLIKHNLVSCINDYMSSKELVDRIFMGNRPMSYSEGDGSFAREKMELIEARMQRALKRFVVATEGTGFDNW